jgi:3-phenylpropionate/trans-cinnamate dioxygenase ferredoxin subunit
MKRFKTESWIALMMSLKRRRVMADLALDQISEGKPVRIEKDGKTICVARVGDEVFAVADTCTHSDASLSEGDVTGFKIECWLHGAEFDLRTGQALTLPANIPLETYAVSIDGNAVTVEI